MFTRLAPALLVLTACGVELAPDQLPATGTSQSKLSAAPSILALNRTGAPPEGGTTLIIAGSNLDPAAAVTFGGVPARSVTTDPNASGTAPSNLVVVTPALVEGFVDVVVTNPDGASATFANFHVGPPPVVTSMNPSTNVRKGDRITLTGANFGDVHGVQVSVGGATAQLLSKSATQLVFAAPKVNAGSYQVFVFNWDSQSGTSPTLLSYRP